MNPGIGRIWICLCALASGCGGGDGGGPPPPPQSHFVYASTYSGPAANGFLPAGIYGFNAGSGLGPIAGSPFSPTLSGPIAFSRDSKTLYTADGTGSRASLAAFLIGPDGSLSPVPGSPFTTPEPVVTLVANPTSDFLYGVGVSGTLLVFAIDAGTGAVSISPAVQAVGSDPTVTPDGRYLYLLQGVPGAIGTQIAGFAVDASTGALSAIPGPLITEAMEPGSPTIDATGRVLYLADTFSQQVIHACCVYGYAIDPNTGVLTQLAGAPFDVGGTVESMTASGRFLIAAIVPPPPNPVGGVCTLHVFSVDATSGALTQTGSLPSQQYCGSVAADSTLPYVYYGVGYESQTGSTVFGYLLDQANGALTQLETAPVPAATMGVVAVTH